MSVCRCVHGGDAGAYRGLKAVPHLEDLELQVVMNYLTWLGTELWSSGREVSALNF